ncbi:uncharacterized protein LAESUDRAFT_759772 [Laetiporus sulphureus 93-53]|uniref:Beta-trefoil n=1 Tax=Laetiporus sulphureus 93-53 TaxID=1314785 RepID=A0A165DYE7_9APHY|nr:uncharacterized protein LAESUDRAFT_759772 [Laetiporus sulphureus 93-53]KZT05872.1 hypothetical protein LAESUDRAFT_759772 [Laetiporus sulphureus 93-53]
MRTIIPFDSSPLLQMASTAATSTHDHLPPPVHAQMSRPASPHQPDLNSLVANHHIPAHPPHPSHPSLSQGRSIDMSSADQLQSIFEAAKQVPVPTSGQIPLYSLPPPPPPPSHQQQQQHDGSNSLPQRAGQKRRLEDTDTEDPHNKIRRVVREHITADQGRVMNMTTVICLHAAVAQKSYGSEKRFLCPPPVVHIEGPVWNMKTQQMAMAVVTETGERSFEQKAPLDHNLNASFKFLHVSGTAKTKSFQLSLDIAEPPPSAPDGGDAGSGRVWASFDSAPVTIISKPSKKTAKTRSISSCILAGGPVSLFNRINSQTVRTKYMTVDHGQLSASNISWSAFNVNVITRPPPTDSDPGPLAGPGPQTVVYGSKIVLTETVTGTSTPPLVIRKVDKGRIAPDDGGPVSQMQKIALQRINPDGSRHYLSAAGPVPGTPGVVVPPSAGMSNQAGSHPLGFQAPRVREEVKDGQTIMIDEVDDYLCWTIVGISKFQYTFFDAFGQNSRIPDLPITPFPTLFTAPLYRSQQNMPQQQVDVLELTAANFFYHNPATNTVDPLDVYLGPLGPLRLRVYQAAAVGITSAAGPSFISPSAGEGPIRFVPTAGTYGPQSTPSNPTAGPLHAIVVVEMPSKGEMLKALEEDALPTNEEAADAAAGKQRSKPERISGRSLPLLFIRAYDGVGYHSGRAIACEYLFKDMDIGVSSTTNGEKRDWAAETAQHLSENSLHNWIFRVM